MFDRVRRVLAEDPRIGYALGALFATALFAWLGTWQLGRGFAKQERLAQAQSARQSETPQPLSMAARAEDQDDEIARVEGRGRYRLPLLVLDNQPAHFLAGQVLPDSWDFETAGESMREVYEIADLIVPGHDNLFLNPRSQGM